MSKEPEKCPEPKSRVLIIAGVSSTGLVVPPAVPRHLLQFQKQRKYRPCNSQPLL